MQVAAQSVGGGGGDGSDTTATPYVTQAPRKMASENFMGTRDVAQIGMPTSQRTATSARKNRAVATSQGTAKDVAARWWLAIHP